MGKVNVVLPDGRVVAVDEETAKEAQGSHVHMDTVAEKEARQAAADKEDVYGGVGGAVASGLIGAADTLTFGGFSGVAQAIGGKHVRDVEQNLADAHPIAHAAGEIAGFAVPGAELAAPGMARGAAEALGGTSKFATRAIEGGILGAGGEVARTQLTGDPLTIEGVLESAGLGATLSVGIGGLSDRFTNTAGRAQTAVDEAGALKEDIGVAQTGAKIFSDPPPSWTDFVESHKAATNATNELNREITKEATDYADFYGSHKLGTAADRTQDVINELQNDRYAKNAAGNIKWVDGKPRAEMVASDQFGQERRVLINSKPPISDELAGRFKEYQRRMSRIYKLQSGGYDLDNSGKWVKASNTPPDPKRALEELRSIQTDLKAEFPKAANGLGKWGDLPDVPRDPVPVSDVRLPKTPREFARMTPEKIADLANNLDPASQESFGRFAADIGVDVKQAPADTVAAVHGTLGDYMKAYDRAQAAAAKSAADEASRPYMLRFFNRAARFAAARAFDVGGLIGAITRTIGGDLVGKAMTGIEDSVLGGAMLAEKEGIRLKVQKLVAKWGVPTANGAEKLRPVTSYLANAWPTGEKDHETDFRTLAARRVTEIANLNATAPDVSFTAIQGLMGQPGDVAFKMHQKLVSTVQHLAATMPKDNGLNTTMMGSNWTPSHHESLELAYRLEAVQDPLTAIARTLSGDSNPAAIQTLWTVWPALMQEFVSETAMNANQLKNITHDQTRAYSALVQQPMSGLQHPTVVTTLQGLYLPQPPAGASGGGGGGSGRPSGRPPAVQSQVTGSNVTSILNQQ